MTLQEATQKYGAIDFKTRRWPDERKHMTVALIPKELHFEDWISAITRKPLKLFYLNRDLKQPLFQALGLVKTRGFESELKTFDGIYNLRFVRGSQQTPSSHAYGLAIDINAFENPLGGKSRFSEGFVKCWLESGFVWGGNFDRKDPQHFSLGW